MARTTVSVGVSNYANRPGWAAAALAEFLGQRGTLVVRKGACKKQLKHWDIASATSVERNGVHEKIAGRTLKQSKQRCLRPFTRSFYRLALCAYSAGVQYGTEELRQNVYKSLRQVEGNQGGK